MPPPLPPNHAISRHTRTTHIQPPSATSTAAQDYTRPPIILAAGLWRTGTSSLQIALESHLDLYPIMHGGDMTISVHKLKLFYACCVEEDDEKRRSMLKGWIEEGRDGWMWMGLTDLPAWAFVEDLVVIYPTMHILLNVRPITTPPTTSWSTSVRQSLAFYSTPTYRLISLFDPHLHWHHMIYVGLLSLLRRRHPTHIRRMSDIFTERFYNVHNEYVRDVARRYGKEGELVEWDVSMGWEGLVQMLGLEKPRDERGVVVEFPRVNEGRGMRELRGYLVWKGVKAWVRWFVGPVVVVVGGGWVAWWYGR